MTYGGQSTEGSRMMYGIQAPAQVTRASSPARVNARRRPDFQVTARTTASATRATRAPEIEVPAVAARATPVQMRARRERNRSQRARVQLLRVTVRAKGTSVPSRWPI